MDVHFPGRPGYRCPWPHHSVSKKNSLLSLHYFSSYSLKKGLRRNGSLFVVLDTPHEKNVCRTEARKECQLPPGTSFVQVYSPETRYGCINNLPRSFSSLPV